MIGALIVSHGNLAKEFLAAARVIDDKLRNVVAVALDWNDDYAASRKKIEAAMRQLENPQGVIILTDMFGGTPSNVSLSFHVRDQVEIVTSVNLPMIVKLGSLRTEGQSLYDTARLLREKGRKSICVASEELIVERAPIGGGPPAT